VRPWLTSGRLLPGLTVRRLLTATPAARLLNKTMSAETADNAGTPQLKQFLMVNTNMFYHPKYYKELRRRNREVLRSGRGLAVNQAPHVSDQAISYEHSTESEGVRPGPGQSLTRDSNADGGEGSSSKHQASSHKLQAASALEI